MAISLFVLQDTFHAFVQILLITYFTDYVGCAFLFNNFYLEIVINFSKIKFRSVLFQG